MAAASQSEIASALNMPDFDGKYCVAWLIQLQAAFVLNGIIDTQKKYCFTVSLIPLPILDQIVVMDKKNCGKHTFGNYELLKRAIVEYCNK